MKEPVKRGRLGAVELLPPTADEAVAWAEAEIRKRQLTQVSIHAEFNRRLAALGLSAVSQSAFNRWATQGLTDGFAPRAPREHRTGTLGLRCPHCGCDLLLSLRGAAP